MTEPLDDARGELLACPFCGSGHPIVSMYSDDMLFKVECRGCAAKVSGFDQCQQDAIDAWNTRAAPERCDAETATLRAQLASARKALDAECEQKYKLVAENLDLQGKIAVLVPPPSEAGREEPLASVEEIEQIIRIEFFSNPTASRHAAERVYNFLDARAFVRRAKTLARQTTPSGLPHREGQAEECDGGLHSPDPGTVAVAPKGEPA